VGRDVEEDEVELNQDEVKLNKVKLDKAKLNKVKLDKVKHDEVGHGGGRQHRERSNRTRPGARGLRRGKKKHEASSTSPRATSLGRYEWMVDDTNRDTQEKGGRLGKGRRDFKCVTG
jgi:hypothetical protein